MIPSKPLALAFLFLALTPLLLTAGCSGEKSADSVPQTTVIAINAEVATNWSESHPNAIEKFEDIPCEINQTFHYGYMRYPPEVDHLAGGWVSCTNGDEYVSYRKSESNFDTYWMRTNGSESFGVSHIGGGGGKSI